MNKDVEIQCPCGTTIRSPKQYRLMFVRKEALEIDILCSNDLCYLKELGVIKFEVDSNGNLKFSKAEFHTPFVTWNTSRIGYEETLGKLKEHLKRIILETIDWNEIKRSLSEGK
ncbi:MAG: hypothetical protein NZ926_01040 [Candidatus Methanomethylicia archaeon]|nr:hypothetical protein [Candidatus Methanomethylicia archaeon]MCX8169015.1 hypothetical protein [Candidatus Methanomethylicia archaeon]MDW7988747.1 hypothetical protein [Nitrososphaerota archaeon]